MAVVVVLGDEPRMAKWFEWGRDDRIGPIHAVGIALGERGAELGEVPFTSGTVFVRPIGPFRFGRRHATWHEGEESITIAVDEEASLSGRILDATGKPLAGGSVWVNNEPQDWFYGKIDPADGHFEIKMLPPGEFTLTVQPPQGTAGQAAYPKIHVTLAPGEEKTLPPIDPSATQN